MRIYKERINDGFVYGGVLKTDCYFNNPWQNRFRQIHRINNNIYSSKIIVWSYHIG